MGGCQLGLQTLGTGSPLEQGRIRGRWSGVWGLCGDEGGPGSHQGPACSSREQLHLGSRVADDRSHACLFMQSCSHPTVSPEAHLCQARCRDAG